MAAGVGAWKSPRSYGRDLVLSTNPYHNQRVRWAVIAIQRELIRRGFLVDPGRPLDGIFGPNTERAAKAFQRGHGLVADGIVGPKTAVRLWADLFAWSEGAERIPGHLVYGMCRLESGLDPGAEGSVDDRDRGIGQFNRHYWPSISDEVAFSRPGICIGQTALNLRQAMDRLGLWDAAIAAHNNPAKAKVWAETGKAPDAQIEQYVALVRQNARL